MVSSYFLNSRRKSAVTAIVSVLVTQSCLTLCDSMDYSPPGSSDYCHLGLVSKGITFLGVVIRGRVNQLPPQLLRAVYICWAFNTHTFPISFPDDQRLVCLWARVVFRCARGVCVGMEGQREGRLQAAPQRGMVFLR